MGRRATHLVVLRGGGPLLQDDAVLDTDLRDSRQPHQGARDAVGGNILRNEDGEHK